MCFNCDCDWTFCDYLMSNITWLPIGWCHRFMIHCQLLEVKHHMIVFDVEHYVITDRLISSNSLSPLGWCQTLRDYQSVDIEHYMIVNRLMSKITWLYFMSDIKCLPIGWCWTITWLAIGWCWTFDVRHYVIVNWLICQTPDKWLKGFPLPLEMKPGVSSSSSSNS